MTTKLPAAVTAYLAADKAHDLDKLCQCFTNDAQVHDESRQYQGHDSIRSWKEQTTAKYQYTVEPLDVAVTERNVKLHAVVPPNSITRSCSQTARSSRWPFIDGESTNSAAWWNSSTHSAGSICLPREF
jgi:hypothetical protein